MRRAPKQALWLYRPDHLHLFPGPLMEGGNWLPGVIFWCPHLCHHVHAHTLLNSMHTTGIIILKLHPNQVHLFCDVIFTLKEILLIRENGLFLRGAEVRDGHFVWCPLWMYSALITGLSSGPSPLINERRREMRAFSVSYHRLRRLPLLDQDCMRAIRFPKVTRMVPSENIWVWKEEIYGQILRQDTKWHLPESGGNS